MGSKEGEASLLHLNETMSWANAASGLCQQSQKALAERNEKSV